MDVLPAIDLRGGGAVRLLRGDYATETSYGDPLDLADAFVAAGAPWLHLVDLDAARDGGAANRTVVLEIARRCGVPVQTGGGVRSLQDVEELIDGGVERVIVGTAAFDGSGMLEAAAQRFPRRVAVGLDYRRHETGRLEIALRGWLEGGGLSLDEAVDRLAGLELAALVVTAIDRDGTLEGPDLEGLRRVLDRSDLPVVASAGVSSAADVVELARLRSSDGGRKLAGAVVGKALVEGRLSVEEAVAACR